MENRLEALFSTFTRRYVLLQEPIVGIYLDVQKIRHFDG